MPHDHFLPCGYQIVPIGLHLLLLLRRLIDEVEKRGLLLALDGLHLYTKHAGERLLVNFALRLHYPLRSETISFADVWMPLFIIVCLCYLYHDLPTELSQ